MNKQITDHVVISGARGFVGKNLKKFLAKNNIHTIPISRQNFKNNKFPSLKKASHFIHLAGVGSESIDQNSFVKVNVELTKSVIDLCKKNNIKNIFYFYSIFNCPISTCLYLSAVSYGSIMWKP